MTEPLSQPARPFRMIRWRVAVGASLGVGICVAAAPSLAAAHSGGRPGGGCIGCHAAGDHSVQVSVNPSTVSPGQEVTMTVRVAGNGVAAGLFVDPGDFGEISTISGQGLSEVPAGLTHNAPKALSGGEATFSFRWQAPNQAGAARFALSSVITNGNGSSGGDQAMHGNFDVVFGCDAAEYYRDDDGDGYGRTSAPLLHCADETPQGYATEPDDCDDSRDGVYPGAQEFCNQRDDDCDDEVDENALPVMQWPDADGDGYYGLEESQSDDTYLGCVPTEGYAAEPGDCDPDDPTRNPGQEEVCNGFDDNCDADVDEGVRPRCGEGWCRREAFTCDEATCYPGEPREEECNLLDDDCDGQLDEGSCPDGQTCVAFECVDVVTEPDTESSGSEGGNASATSDDDGGVTSGTGQHASSGAVATDPIATAGGTDEGANGCACSPTNSRSDTSLALLALVGGLLWRRRKVTVCLRDPASR